jgi:hypothetical protein
VVTSLTRRVHSAPDSSVGYPAKSYHGTSLLDRVAEPLLEQMGAFTIGSRLAGIWRRYKAGKLSQDDAAIAMSRGGKEETGEEDTDGCIAADLGSRRIRPISPTYQKPNTRHTKVSKIERE